MSVLSRFQRVLKCLVTVELRVVCCDLFVCFADVSLSQVDDVV